MSLGFVVEENTTGLLRSNPRLEADIYIPSKNLIIEFDGVWWHSEGPSREHSGRSRLIAQPGETLRIAQEFNDIGIRIIRVFSDEWALLKDIVKSRIRSILGVSQVRMNARSLIVDLNVNLIEATEFIRCNHIQQNVTAKDIVAVGLRDNAGKLLSVMTFGMRSISGSAILQLELLGFCNILNTTIRGAASRLLKAFLRNYDCDSNILVTYADLRWSSLNDTCYTKIGFTFDSIVRPSYYYVHPSQSNKRISRITLQRHKLLKLYPDLDPLLSEREMIELLGYSRVWNSGQLKFVLTV